LLDKLVLKRIQSLNGKRQTTYKKRTFNTPG
jgi:hypothetical protein